MKDKKEIGEFFKDNLETYKAEPSSKVWSKLEGQLPTSSQLFSFNQIMGLIVLVAIVTGTAWYTFKEKQSTPAFKIAKVAEDSVNKLDVKRVANNHILSVNELSDNEKLVLTNKELTFNLDHKTHTKTEFNHSKQIRTKQHEYGLTNHVNRKEDDNHLINKKITSDASVFNSPPLTIVDKADDKLLVNVNPLTNEVKSIEEKDSIVDLLSQTKQSLPTDTTNLIVLADTSKTDNDTSDVKTFFNRNIKVRGYININVFNNQAFDQSVGLGFDMGGIFEDKIHFGFTSSITIKENYINENIYIDEVDLNTALLGVDLGYNFSPKNKVSVIPFLRYQMGYLQYNISNSPTYENLYEETIQNIELGTQVYLNLTKSIRLGGFVSYGFSSKVNKIPNVTNDDYTGIKFGGSLQFHSSNWKKKKVKYRGTEYEQLAPPSTL